MVTPIFSSGDGAFMGIERPIVGLGLLPILYSQRLHPFEAVFR